MKTSTKHLTIKTDKRIDFINITKEVEEVVREFGVREGIVLINPMHITASVFINDNEGGLLVFFFCRSWGVMKKIMLIR
ncbi:hypothetical protein BMS3Abin17_00432 [archaeon BMS3Abin17]|nr:hypothetical protein BMS3Abin17_00432 [archaeon BMS3Abin17]HDZ60328.1 hypothetical protein [Candidatus Pacearchaeota archaeon]